jgi:hypothetical protein
MSSSNTVVGTPYQYKPLPPGRIIRTLLLRPARKLNDPIRISLGEQPLDALGNHLFQYEALSYVWGANKRDQTIEFDGQILLVTPNCLAALQHLRLKRKARRLWIDAICIDQSSNMEKQNQLKLMGEVYKSASQVLIWLGHGSKNAKKEMRIIAAMRKAGKVTRYLPNPLSMAVRFACLLPLGIFTEPEPALYDNEWFRRAWTLQEFCFSRKATIIYDTVAMKDWQFLKAASYILVSWPKVTKFTEIQNLEYLGASFHSWKDVPRIDHALIQAQPGQKLAFKNLLATIRSRQSTDPHDSVYAFYPLLQALEFDVPEPDYDSDVRQLFTDITISLMKDFQSLEALYYVSSTVRDPDLPSWVPDYRQRTNAWTRWRSHTVIQKSLLLERIPAPKRRSNVLDVVGHILGVVNAPFPKMPELTPQQEKNAYISCLNVFCEWFNGSQSDLLEFFGDAMTINEFSKFVLGSPNSLIRRTFNQSDSESSDSDRTGSIYRKRVWTLASIALLSDSHDNEKSQNKIKSMSRVITFLHNEVGVFDRTLFPFDDRTLLAGEYLFELLENWNRIPGSVKWPVDARLTRAITVDFIASTADHSLFFTSTGLMGIVPGQVQRGDVLVSIIGLYIPIMVRRTPGSDNFAVVGPALTVGIPEEELDQWKSRRNSQVSIPLA